MELHLWLSFVVICLLGALSPGPSLALVIKNTVNGGVSKGYATSISHGLGVALYAAITATGIAVVIVNTPLLFSFIQYAGAAFLLFLGVKSLLSKKSKLITPEEKDVATNNINGWRDGFLIAFLNPKLTIFFIALFSQFLDSNSGVEQKVIMTVTVGMLDALWYCLVTYLISRGNIINKLKKNSYIIDKVMGCFLVVLAIRIVVVN